MTPQFAQFSEESSKAPSPLVFPRRRGSPPPRISCSLSNQIDKHTAENSVDSNYERIHAENASRNAVPTYAIWRHAPQVFNSVEREADVRFSGLDGYRWISMISPGCFVMATMTDSSEVHPERAHSDSMLRSSQLTEGLRSSTRRSVRAVFFTATFVEHDDGQETALNSDLGKLYQRFLVVFTSSSFTVSTSCSMKLPLFVSTLTTVA